MVSSGTGSPTLPSTTTTKMAAYPQCPTNWWRSLTKPSGAGGSPAARASGDDAHVPVLLEEGVADVADRDHPVVTEGGAEVPRPQALAPQVVAEDAAVPDEQSRGVLHHAVGPLEAEGDVRDHQVEQEDGGGPDESAPEGVVVADHRVLHHVADDEEHDQVEGAELAELPLAAEPEGDEEEQVHDHRADQLLGDADVGYEDVQVGPVPAHSIALAPMVRSRI